MLRDDGVTGILLAHLRVFGSGELISEETSMGAKKFTYVF